MVIPHLDRIAFNLFSIPVYWYGIAYLISFAISYLGMRIEIYKNPGILFNTEKEIEDLITFSVIGIIVGGRLGEVLFYNPEYYIGNLVEIFNTRNGGMSFHGGLVGATLAFGYYTKKYNKYFLELCDFLIPYICIGLFLGRVANFINAEIIGNLCNPETTFCFYFVDLNGWYYPVSLFEATLEGILLGVVSLFLNRNVVGLRTGLFLVGYGAIRSFLEIYKQDISGIFPTQFLSMGQYLNMPLIGIGILILIFKIKHR